MTNTNRDYLADWVKTQAPIQGFDRTRGHDGRGNPSAIEDSILTAGGELHYTNPMIRVGFFTQSKAVEYAQRVAASTGLPVSLRKHPDFDTAQDPQGRSAYYLKAGDLEVPLSRLRYLASTGKDANGKQLYSSKDYQIQVDGPGKFLFVPPTEAQAEFDYPGDLVFEPARKDGN